MIDDGRQENIPPVKEVKDLTEEQALRQIKRGSQEALAWFIDRYGAYVSAIIRGILGAALTVTGSAGPCRNSLSRRTQFSWMTARRRRR